jgi:DNA-binding GntR family transcriptional regulator
MRDRRIDPTADRAAYKQVADALRDDIVSGRLAPGRRIPAEFDLCEEFEVSRNTVRQALTILRSEGLIETARPTGSRVRDPQERAVVEIPPGARIITRMPTEEERRRLGIAEGTPVFEVEIGGEVQVLPGDRVAIETVTEDRPSGRD